MNEFDSSALLLLLRSHVGRLLWAIPLDLNTPCLVAEQGEKMTRL
jgi:hypothetical protein